MDDNIGIFSGAYDDEDVGGQADLNNLETTMNMDVKSAFLYGTIEEVVYVCQPPGFEDPHFLDKFYKVEKALYGLHEPPGFDVDSLSKSMNYVPVVVGNKTKGIEGTRDNIVAGPKDSEEDAGVKPTEVDKSEASNKDRKDEQDSRSEFERLLQQEKQTEHPNSTNSINTISTPVSTDEPSSTYDAPSSPINAAKSSKEHLIEQFSPFKNAFTLPDVPNVSPMDDNTRIFAGAYVDEDVGGPVNLNNLDKKMNEPKKVIQALEDPSWIEAMQEELLQFELHKERLVAQGYTEEEGIDYDEFSAPVARIEAIRLFLAYASYMGFIVYQMDVKSAFLYGTIEEEVYVCQPPSFEDPHFPDKVYKVEKALYGLHQAPRAWYETLSTYLIENGFRRGTIDKTLFIKKDKGDILLVQVYVDDIIFGSTKKSLCDEFEVQQKEDGIFISQDKYVAEILKKFDFATVKTTSTPIETNKALVKDEEAEAVDVHLYRSMIGSLMYLTASRPDIMFAVCACARFQVTPKMSHLHAVKRIFRYLKGQPKLGLWYPRDSPFDLEAFSDSDYAGASLDRKSTIGGCQFLGKRLISWQCKKQTIVANSTTEAEYVAAANCCGQVLWIQNQMLDYGFNFMNTKIYIDNESTICIVKNPVFHSKTKHIEIRHHFIRDSYEKKLIQVIKIHTDHNVADLLTKAFDVSSCKVNTARQKISTARQKLVLLSQNETVYKEWEDKMEMAATIASSLDTEQDSDAQTRFETTFKKSNDPPLSRGYTLGSGEDNMKLLELMELCTKLSDLVSKKKREML
ncbi:putative ribonuclease H-like domain-containing protein [Tanacetum coccineum]